MPFRQIGKSLIVWFLTLEARLILSTYKPRVVAVTGSVGKTSAKDAIYAVLAHRVYVRKSEKSFNSEIGVPLTILGRPNAWSNPLRWIENLLEGLLLFFIRVEYPEWLVLEVGADRPHDIRSVAAWLPVDLAVITRLPEVPVHVEFFDSPEAVVAEKATLIDAIVPGGVLVLYADDERALTLKARAQGTRVLTFGFSKNADIRGEEVVLIEAGGRPLGMHARIVGPGGATSVSITGAIGAHALLPLLAAAATAEALTIPIAEAATALAQYEPPPGRMRLVKGIKDTIIIDDSYNSSPAAAAAALDTLSLLSMSGRKIVVLGDMLELGRHSVVEHKKLGSHAARVADMLLTVGFRARDAALAALDNSMEDSNILQFEDARQAGQELQNILESGDCVLVKGSQSMRMERVVEEIMTEPERAAELLVRQDREWKKR